MKDNEDNKSDRDYEELRLLYQMAVSDIALFKQQQWKITNYGLLLYAAINAIPKILDGAVTNTEFLFLFIVAFTILGTGCFLLSLLEKSIKKGRCRLIETSKSFTETFKHALRCGKPESGRPDRPDDKPSLMCFFCAVLSLGFIITSWLLYRMACATCCSVGG